MAPASVGGTLGALVVPAGSWLLRSAGRRALFGRGTRNVRRVAGSRDVTMDFGWRWLGRIANRSAMRHTTATYDAQLSGRSAGTGAFVVLLVSSWMLYLLTAALFGVGLWLCSLSFPGPG